ncbi:MAG: hypothetical protein M5U28_03445 [Sandaracinaceae bacterium]|nr:hypothetical protein [Sandaracinaceae bacterium]
MGYGSYDLDAHIAATRQRAARAPTEVFSQGSCHPAMQPHGVRYRESRDSEVHPSSVGIVFALDVSGSMGQIPRQLATETLPSFMKAVLTVLPDPQVLFLAFGNAYADRSPLQVGQFESEAALIDKWLGGDAPRGRRRRPRRVLRSGHVLRGAAHRDGLPREARQEGLLLHDRRRGALRRGERRAGAQAARVGPAGGHPHPRDDGGAARALPRLLPHPGRARAAAWECGAVWSKLLAERAVVLDRPDDTAVACALLIGVQEGTLKSRADLERQLEVELDRHGEARDRVVRAVLPYAEALARGPIRAPQPLARRADPGTQG